MNATLGKGDARLETNSEHRSVPLDHFVSQVHLKNFYATEAPGRLVAIKKDDLRKFHAWSKNVCARSDGSTNTYLQEPRAIEKFLKRVEGRYNEALEAIRRREPDGQDVYVIAGFVAYVASCSPTAMRMSSPFFAATVESAAEIVDAQGLIPPAPEELGSKTVTQLLRDGSVHIKVDEKYPQAIGISQIEARVHVFGNALWDVMFADPDDGAFCTSDFPIALGPSYEQQVVSKTVPLAPDVAVRIHPKLSERGKPPDFSFPNFQGRFRRLDAKEIREVNRELVRAAEEMVFFTRDEDWLLTFVRNNRHFRSDATVTKVPTPAGKMIIARQGIVPFTRPALIL